MAADFGPAFAPALSLTNSKPRAEVATVLERYKPRGEIKRFLNLPLGPTLVDAEPIRAVTVDGVAWPDAN